MANGGLCNSWKASSHISGKGSRKEVGLVCAEDGTEMKGNLSIVLKQNEHFTLVFGSNGDVGREEMTRAWGWETPEPKWKQHLRVLRAGR